MTEVRGLQADLFDRPTRSAVAFPNGLAPMSRSALLAVVAAVSLGGCVTHEFPDSSKIYGQNIDAARALYGEYAQQMRLDGKNYYIWRRGDVSEGEQVYCELWVEVGPKRIIARRFLQGHPVACQLF